MDVLHFVNLSYELLLDLFLLFQVELLSKISLSVSFVAVIFTVSVK